MAPSFTNINFQREQQVGGGWASALGKGLGKVLKNPKYLKKVSNAGRKLGKNKKVAQKLSDFATKNPKLAKAVKSKTFKKYVNTEKISQFANSKAGKKLGKGAMKAGKKIGKKMKRKKSGKKLKKFSKAGKLLGGVSSMAGMAGVAALGQDPLAQAGLDMVQSNLDARAASGSRSSPSSSSSALVRSNGGPISSSKLRAIYQRMQNRRMLKRANFRENAVAHRYNTARQFGTGKKSKKKKTVKKKKKKSGTKKRSKAKVKRKRRSTVKRRRKSGLSLSTSRYNSLRDVFS